MTTEYAPDSDALMQDIDAAIFRIATCMPTRIPNVTTAVRSVLLLIEEAQKGADGAYAYRPDVREAVDRLQRGTARAEHFAIIADAFLDGLRNR